MHLYDSSSHHVARYMVVAAEDKKKDKLSELYGAMNVGQSIIFVNTRHLKHLSTIQDAVPRQHLLEGPCLGIGHLHEERRARCKSLRWPHRSTSFLFR